MAIQKYERRLKIRKGIRKKVKGTPQRPRLSVFRSNRGIYAQIINDEEGHTLISASSPEIGAKNLDIEISKNVGNVGKKLAEKATAKGIERVVFDRGGYIYHGKVKALAEGAKEGGLKF